MPPEDPTPANDYTALAVQLGVIQEGQRNTLTGIDDIKNTLEKHGDRLGTVESAVAVVTTRVNAHDAILTENRVDAKPQRGRWAAIVSACGAAGTLVLFILDRLYVAH
jgi:uncharacterized protein (DUF3084 family)